MRTEHVISNVPSLRERPPSSAAVVPASIPVVPLVEVMIPNGITVRPFAIQDPPVYPESAPVNHTKGFDLPASYGMNAYKSVSDNSARYTSQETAISIYV